jgi:hypothetical protein
MASAETPEHAESTRGLAREGRLREGARLEHTAAGVARNSRLVLAGLLVTSAALLFYMGRGLSFFYDDWDFVTHDYGGGVHSLLAAHSGNISVFPVAVYKILFHLVGLNHYAVFRSVVIALHVACGTLIYILAARRVPAVPALLAAGLILFLGAAWEDLLWAFQVGYLLSATGGLAAWVLLDRRRAWSRVAATACLVVAAGSSSLGIAILVGVAVELAWARRWQDGWVVAVPVALYALWYLGYGESQVTTSSLINAPGFAEDLAAASFGALAGRSLEWGRPLALVGALLLMRRLARPLPVSPRLAGLLATGLALWAITAAARSTISPPEASRYVYLGAIVIVLVAIESLRGVVVSSRTAALAAVVVALCALTGLTALHAGATSLRSTSKTVTAELAALEIAARYVPPNYQPDPVRAPQIQAGPYLHTVRALGSSPADTPAQLIAAEVPLRTLVDANLIKLEAVTVGAVPTHLRLSASPPVVAGALGSQPDRAGGCWLTTSTGTGYTEFIVPSTGVLIRTQAQAVQVAARRFAPPLGGVPLGPIAAHEAALVRFPPDASDRPWLLRLAGQSPTEICTVR